jgi:hypothetical protein
MDPVVIGILANTEYPLQRVGPKPNSRRIIAVSSQLFQLLILFTNYEAVQGWAWE